jgi:hypothetical protein
LIFHYLHDSTWHALGRTGDIQLSDITAIHVQSHSFYCHTLFYLFNRTVYIQYVKHSYENTISDGSGGLEMSAWMNLRQECKSSRANKHCHMFVLFEQQGEGRCLAIVHHQSELQQPLGKDRSITKKLSCQTSVEVIAPQVTMIQESWILCHPKRSRMPEAPSQHPLCWDTREIFTD